jgi:putative SOS response-associated peptidase YedK
MCGRYTLTETDQLKKRFGLARVPSNIHKNFNVAPTQTMPVIINIDDKPEVVLMRWGIPRFIGPGKVKDVFNTRSDKAFFSWKKLTLSQRVLIPASGFYEWKTRAGGKQPFFIHPKGDELFAFAGIWNTWIDDNDVETKTYSIMTTDPNKEMSSIHNRMPVILHQIDESIWLSHANDNKQGVLEELLRPYDDELEAYEVSKDVNVTKNNDKKLVYPLNAQ